MQDTDYRSHQLAITAANAGRMAEGAAMAALLAAFWMISAMPAGAQSFPHYDVNAYCNEVARHDGSYSATIDRNCSDRERQAYDTLKGKWASIPASAHSYCEQVADFDGRGSYAILRDCIEILLMSQN